MAKCDHDDLKNSAFKDDDYKRYLDVYEKGVYKTKNMWLNINDLSKRSLPPVHNTQAKKVENPLLENAIGEFKRFGKEIYKRDLEVAYENKKNSFTFSAEIKKNFLSIIINNEARLVNLDKVNYIFFERGTPVLPNGNKCKIYSSYDEIKHYFMISYDSPASPFKLQTQNLYTTRDYQIEDSTVDCATPSKDDIVMFNGLDIHFNTPYGLAEEVYKKITEAING